MGDYTKEQRLTVKDGHFVAVIDVLSDLFGVGCEEVAHERQVQQCGLFCHFLLSFVCKDNANRTQSSLLEIAKVQLILCKDNANRTQSSLLEIAEVQLIFYKDNA